jgi:hypothetical protein
LAKIGLSLLPSDAIEHYSKLRSWVLTDSESEPFPFLDVGISIGSIGNAPPLVVATLLKRTKAPEIFPHTILGLCAGSVFWFIDLMSDDLEAPEGALPFGFLDPRWNVEISDGISDRVRVEYGPPQHFDWSSDSLIPTPVGALAHRIDPIRNRAQISVEWREMYPPEQGS